MQVSRWIKASEVNGWRVQSVSADGVRLSCSCVGCVGGVSRFLDDLGAVPEPCNLEHIGQMSPESFQHYKDFVAELRRRRMQLGLDQADLGAAMGVADGYVNKIEAFHRMPTFQLVALWCQTLGVTLSLDPVPLPSATLRAIERRGAKPYQPNQARFNI